jgi:hypothetical protein
MASYAAEMDNGDRIYQATFGVITAIGFKKQMDADPICKGSVYPDFDLNQFLDAIPKDFLTDPDNVKVSPTNSKGIFKTSTPCNCPTVKPCLSPIKSSRKALPFCYAKKPRAVTWLICVKKYMATPIRSSSSKSRASSC